MNMSETKNLFNMLAKILIRCFLYGMILLVFVFVFFLLVDDWAYSIHSKWYQITKDQFDLIMYVSMSFIKLSLFVWFLLPYIAIKMVLRKK